MDPSGGGIDDTLAPQTRRRFPGPGRVEGPLQGGSVRVQPSGLVCVRARVHVCVCVCVFVFVCACGYADDGKKMGDSLGDGG